MDVKGSEIQSDNENRSMSLSHDRRWENRDPRTYYLREVRESIPNPFSREKMENDFKTCPLQDEEESIPEPITYEMRSNRYKNLGLEG